jgi:hypothetical protein
MSFECPLDSVALHDYSATCQTFKGSSVWYIRTKPPDKLSIEEDRQEDPMGQNTTSQYAVQEAKSLNKKI